jgi:hypothetical protein
MRKHQYKGGLRWLVSDMQNKCSMYQLGEPGSASAGASLSFTRCAGHQGVMHLPTQSVIHNSIKLLRCTNCSGCKECRQPVPLVITEGTGGSGCSAEVAAQAEALRAHVQRNIQGRQDQQDVEGSAGSSSSNSSVASNPAACTSDNGNPVLVECAVCHRKPGDPGVPATLKLCGGCQGVRYCSTECQRKDWKLGHKAICEQWRKARQACQQLE